MKKIILLFLFSVLLLSSKAQTSVYHPFPDSNAVWNGNSFCSMPSFQEFYSYMLDGDSLVNGKIYHKLVMPALVRPDSILTQHHVGYQGCIRQDVSVRKVFYIKPGETTERLLYNFNLQVGDTFNRFTPIILCTSWNNEIVYQIDSILIGSDYRKRWVFPAYSIIEGIGAAGGAGLLEPACSSCNYSGLLCFKQNGVTLYPDTTTSCDIIASVNNLSLLNNPISIYPNPIHNSGTLQFNIPLIDAEVIIYDILGHEMMRKKMNGDRMEIERGSLESGVYFVKVRGDEREWVGKVVVN